MRVKKWLKGIGVLCLWAVMLLPLQVHAQEQESSTTTLTTKVPDTHTVYLEITGNGSVEIDGKIYTQSAEIEVGRLKEQTYLFWADEGYRLVSVYYSVDTEYQEVALQGSGSYTAPAVYADGNRLTVLFEKSGSSGSSTGTSQTGSVNTGDRAQTGMMAALLFLSAGVIVISLLGRYREKKRAAE